MDLRPAYWALSGACVTLLTSAWGSNQVMPPPQDQNLNANVASVIAETAFDLPHGMTNNGLSKKNQSWTKAKSNPFSKANPDMQKVTAQTVTNGELIKSQSVSFPYVFIGRLSTKGSESVFLSKDNQIYSVATGDTLGGVYRIDRVGSNELEVNYLPGQKKLNISFDAIALKPVPKSSSVAEANSSNVLHSSTLPTGLGGEELATANGQKIGSPNQVLASSQTPQGVASSSTGAGSAPMSTGIAGSAPGVSNGQITPDVQQMLAPAPPPQGDALQTMGASPPPQGDPLKIMNAHPPQAGQTMP